MSEAKTAGMSRGLKACIFLAAALAGSSLFLLVLPGYYLYLAGDLPFGARFGRVHGDNLLPIAMQVQVLWAPMLPIAYALAARLHRRMAGLAGLAAVTVLALCLLYGWAVVLAVMFHSLSAEAAA
jgi:hypothetical protein